MTCLGCKISTTHEFQFLPPPLYYIKASTSPHASIRVHNMRHEQEPCTSALADSQMLQNLKSLIKSMALQYLFIVKSASMPNFQGTNNARASLQHGFSFSKNLFGGQNFKRKEAFQRRHHDLSKNTISGPTEWRIFQCRT